MLADILSKDLDKALKNTQDTQAIIERIYYSDDLSLFFRKTFISLMSTALSFLESNLKVMKVQYTAKLEAKKE